MENWEKESKRVQRAVHLLKELEGKAPRIFGIPTGTKLDEMFFISEIDEKTGKPIKKVLGGIPYRSVINVVGVPDTGKSVLAEQFAAYQAGNGYRILFITSESPAEFLYNSIKQKCIGLGINFEEVDKNIVVIDASKETDVRENVFSLIKTIEYAVEKYKTTITVIDSITGFYEHREMLARQIVRRVFNALKKLNQTAMLVSQKRSSQGSETAEAAGGLAVAHILDGTIVLDKKVIESRWDERLYGLPIGEVIRTIRIDGCRLAGHDKDVWVMDINELGLIEIKQKLKEFIKHNRKNN